LKMKKEITYMNQKVKKLKLLLSNSLLIMVKTFMRKSLTETKIVPNLLIFHSTKT